MSLQKIEPVIAIVIGLAILIQPALLAYLVATYLILIGVLRLVPQPS